ncbi:MAG: hypothetical protein HC787_02300 [Nostocaceae cyanobacterium CSU_2_110]|nr:hypothetical protein [Nostocaceae cyanobacterium CSU_2_110]
MLQIDNFFQSATTEKDWYDDEERETVKKYQTLLETLKTKI